jgi:hypothetical protein
MSGKLYHLPTSRWSKLQLWAAMSAGLLLLPFVLVALIPMLIMFVPIAVVGIPVIVPVMLSGKLAARWEGEQRAQRARSVRSVERAPIAVR